MPHLDDSLLRARLDQELPADSAAATEAHLALCADCRRRLDEIGDAALRVQATLSILAPFPGESAAPAAVALARIRLERLPAASERSLMSRLLANRYRPLFAGIGFAAVVAIALSFPPARAFASRVLGLFRVERIAVVPIDPTRLSELHRDSSIGTRMSQLLSDSVTTLRERKAPVVAATLDEASGLAGYALRLPAEPADTSPPAITVQSGTAFELRIDRTRAQAILDDAGHPDLRRRVAYADSTRQA